MKQSMMPLAIAAALGFANLAMAGNNGAEQRALAQIEAHGQAVGKANGDTFTARDVMVDADGTEHVRFDRSYNGLPVIGGDVVVHSGNGAFKGSSQTLKDSSRPGLSPKWSSEQAIVEAGADFGSSFDGTPTARLVIYARGNKPLLAHEVVFSGTKADGTPTEAHYVIDAQTGHTLDKWDGVETGKPGGGGTGGGTDATGTAKTLYSGNVAIHTALSGGSYNMTDVSRGGGYTTNMANGTRGNGTLFTDADNIWGNNATSDVATAAADAHFGVAVTWDYYKTVHGRNGIANDGKGALSRVHYSRNYVNAFWSDSCFCMTFGDGDGVSYLPLVNLDVAGHEMSHGVTSRTANLTYSGESGGLNEATSDIFGTMVEYFANNANDAGDYKIGEKIYKSNPGESKALRYMWSPNSDGGYSSDCWYSGVGSLDVHYSSGPANHFYYILAEGTNGPNGQSPTCVAGNTKKATGNANLSGITRAKAEKIWYRALTVYMTSSTNYAGARTATLNAASDLYGASSAERSAVAAAWSAVGVN